MEQYLTPDEASRADKCLSLIRKAMIVNKKSTLYEVWVDTNNSDIDFRFYAKGKNDYLLIESIGYIRKFDFEEKFMLLNYKLNQLIEKNYLPI